MKNQVKLINVLESFLHDVAEEESTLDEIINVLGYDDLVTLLEMAKKSVSPVPTIKPGDRVRHEEYGEGWTRTYGEESTNRAIGANGIWVSFDELDYDTCIPIADLEVVE